MRFIGPAPAHDLTYSDVFLVPSQSDVSSRFDVSLDSGDGSGMSTPVVSANMNSVTGPRLAATMARRGGLGVIPQDLPLSELAAAVRAVKGQSPTYDTPFAASPDRSVAEVLRELPPVEGHGVVVSDERGYLGFVASSELAHALPDAPIGDLVRTSTAIDADDVTTPRQVFDLLTEAGLEVVPVMRHGHIVGTISRRSALRSTIYQPNIDEQGRLRVAVALGIRGNLVEKAAALVEAGVDVLVVDTAHGHQRGTLDALREVRDANLGVPVVAGNVVTAQGAADLIEAGANIVKVGVGPGAMCTTRMMTAVGRPQFSAVLECAAAARSLGGHVWADGGVRHPRDIALGLAAGASAVMVGSWFAGTIEAPGELRRDASGRLFKESWGMASAKAVSARFAKLDAYELARKEMFAEGISSSSVLLDPLRPSVEDLLDMITTGVRSSFTYAGARSLAEFWDRAVAGVQSAAGYEEGKARSIV
ncbi:MAG TPA: GuaB1 family IMP dehydrogenase-related protein [Candidatus Lumbricidophila sp.]|nr:GuaB1 family IMP dehydrogenase-related protein [Candidatus Lumbricidophila sp.]